MGLPRPGHREHCASTSPFFGSLALREASCHVVRTLKPLMETSERDSSAVGPSAKTLDGATPAKP